MFYHHRDNSKRIIFDVLLYFFILFATFLIGWQSEQSSSLSEDENSGVADIIMDGYYSNINGNQRQLVTSSPDYLDVSDQEIYAALSDKDIDVYRDNRECTYAFDMFRTHVKQPIMIYKRGLASKAERWAVYLASRWRKQNEKKFDFSEEERSLGQLIYFAENMDQGPGCEMAINGWAK